MEELFQTAVVLTVEKTTPKIISIFHFSLRKSLRDYFEKDSHIEKSHAGGYQWIINIPDLTPGELAFCQRPVARPFSNINIFIE